MAPNVDGSQPHIRRSACTPAHHREEILLSLPMTVPSDVAVHSGREEGAFHLPRTKEEFVICIMLTQLPQTPHQYMYCRLRKARI